MKTNQFFPTGVLRIIICLVLFTTVTSVSAQRERMQTALIYQLTQLVEWCPQGKEGNFVIGVYGDEPGLMAELNALNNRRVGSQQIEVKSFNGLSDISEANILFVPESKFNGISEINSRLNGFCTLIVSDQQGAASRGAGISSVYNEREGRVVLELNRGFMRSNSLTVSNRLVNLASNIY